MNKTTAFVSYAHEDDIDAQKLYKDLCTLNVKPWLDSECLLPGQDWRNAIEDAIRSSDFFIAIISSKSVSKRGYVQKELKIALDVLGEIPTSEIYIIPVRINDCEVKEPKLKSLHYVDLFPEWRNGVEKIRKSINYRKNREETTDNINFIKKITEDVTSGQLEYAIGDGDIELVEDLLKNGANPNYPTDAYGSLLGYALSETEDKQVEYSLAKILIEYGADILALGFHNNGLLSNVAYLNKVDVTKLLIKNGVDINKADNKGVTPLMHAAEFHALDVVKVLLESGANINKLDNENNTALILAVYNDDNYDNIIEGQVVTLKIVELLVKFGAEISHQNKDGKSALYYAKELKLERVIERLAE